MGRHGLDESGYVRGSWWAVVEMVMNFQVP